jgi:hypothetical protein
MTLPNIKISLPFFTIFPIGPNILLASYSQTQATPILGNLFSHKRSQFLEFQNKQKRNISVYYVLLQSFFLQAEASFGS